MPLHVNFLFTVANVTLSLIIKMLYKLYHIFYIL